MDHKIPAISGSTRSRREQKQNQTANKLLSFVTLWVKVEICGNQTILDARSKSLLPLSPEGGA
jgi:hypothetical protein